MIAFKALRHGRSPYQPFTWSLPDRRTGKPGAWAMVAGERPVRAGFWGFHAYTTKDGALGVADCDEVFEIELDGEIAHGTGGLVAAARARLTKFVATWDWESAEILQRGWVPCVDCGEPHHLRRRGAGQTWAGPDGHPYRQPRMEEYARSLYDELANLRGAAA